MRVIATSRSLGVVTISVPVFFIGRLPLCASAFFLLGFRLFGLQLFKNGVQTLEIALPNTTVSLDPHFKLAKRLGPQLINPALSVDANFHQSGIAEDAEMFRDLRLAEAQALDHVTDGARAVAQEFDDLKAAGFGERSQSG
jgi:hypothetical protein